MANTTPEYIRGFLIPLDVDTDNIWTAQSTFTTYDNFAGDPTPQQTNPMRLYATGRQTASSDLTITTRRAGYAGFGAGFTYTDNADAGTIYGRDPQNQISYWSYVKSSFSASIKYLNPTGLDAGDGDILIAYGLSNTVMPKYGVFIVKQTQDGTQTTNEIYSQTTANSQDFYPVMCTLQNGEYLLAHLTHDEDDEAATLRTYTSTDGETWTTRSRAALENRINTGTATGTASIYNTHNIQRVRIAQTNGVILLMIETTWNNTSATKRNRLLQYASSDNGATFSLVTTESEIDDNSFHSIQLYATNGQFSFAYIGALAETHYMRIPHAYMSAHRQRQSGSYVVVTQTTAATGTNDFMSGGELAAWTDEHFSNHVIVQAVLLAGTFYEFYSDNFLDWRVMGSNTNGNGLVFHSGDNSSDIQNFHAFSALGRSLLLCKPSTTATNTGALMIELGGYANVTLPETRGYRFGAGLGNPLADYARMSFGDNFIGHDLFSNYSTLTAGGGSETLGADGVTIGGGQKYTRNMVVVGTTSQIVGIGIIARARLKASTGGGLTGSEIRGLELKIDDTSTDYNVQIRITPNSMSVYDLNAGAQAASLTGLTLNNGVELIIGFSSGKIDVWMRETGTQSARRKYTKAFTLSGLTAGSGGASNVQSLVIGNLAYSSGTLTTVVQEFHVANAINIGENLHSFSSPDDLQTRAYPSSEKFAYIHDNVSISATDGPTYEGDEFKVLPTSSTPIENIFYNVSPTPRIPWKSQSVSAGANVAEQFIAIKLDSDTSVHIDESLPNDILGLHLNNYNFRTARLEYYSSGSWTVLDTFQCAILTQGNSQGRTLRGASGANEEPYLHYNECEGWYAHIQTASGYAWRKVVSNSEGVFGGTSTGTKQAVLTLDSSIVASSGATIYLIPKSFTLLVNLNGRRVEALGLRITTNTSYDNYFQIGTMVLGSVLVAGKQYQRGRSIMIDSGTETTETEDGIVYSRNQRPSRRRYRLAWTEGVDISRLQGTDPTPDYWKSSSTSGAEPIAIQNDVPDLLQGLLTYLKGNTKPIVYIPLIIQTSDTRELTRAKEQTLVTLESEVTIEHTLGDELVNINGSGGEVFRVATMSFLEVI